MSLFLRSVIVTREQMLDMVLLLLEQANMYLAMFLPEFCQELREFLMKVKVQERGQDEKMDPFGMVPIEVNPKEFSRN